MAALEELRLANDVLDEPIELCTTLLVLDLLLLKAATLDEIIEIEEAFELDSDARLDELFEAELITDELKILDATALDLLELDSAIEDELDSDKELTDEDIFDELLLTTALELELELNLDEELELNTILIDEIELETALAAANEELFALDTATTNDDIELLLFSARLTLELAAELVTTATELELTRATELLLELAGVGDGEALPPPSPPQALSSKDKTTIFATKKCSRKLSNK